jgi:peptide deformylase
MSKYIKRILQIPDNDDKKILSKVCEPIDFKHDKDLNEILKYIGNTLISEPTGIGLAANQIGILKRIFFMKTNRTTYQIFINPKIIKFGGKQFLSTEGCLSLPGKPSVTKRHESLILKWYTRKGEPKIKEFKDLKAVIIQHEIDHLNGILI